MDTQSSPVKVVNDNQDSCHAFQSLVNLLCPATAFPNDFLHKCPQYLDGILTGVEQWIEEDTEAQC